MGQARTAEAQRAAAHQPLPDNGGRLAWCKPAVRTPATVAHARLQPGRVAHACLPCAVCRRTSSRSPPATPRPPLPCVPPSCLQFGRASAMASLSQRSSQESGSRRRAGFSMAKAGAGQDHSNATTDLTKLPAGFLEGEPPSGGGAGSATVLAHAPGTGRPLGAARPGGRPLDAVKYLHCCTLPPLRRSLPVGHQAGGVRGGGVLWRGAPPGPPSLSHVPPWSLQTPPPAWQRPAAAPASPL